MGISIDASVMPEVGQDLDLALGRGATVGAHRRDDERLRPHRPESLARGPQDGRLVADPPAACGQRDPHPGPHSPPKRIESRRRGRRDVGECRV